MELIASEEIFFESPNPQEVFCFSPGLANLPGGRLLATFDLGGPGVAKLPGPRSTHGDFACGNQGKVYLSDDDGKSWRHAADLPMLHARPFAAGKSVYVIGHGGALCIAASRDNGESWGAPVVLDSQSHWHQAPCTVDCRHGRIYLTMEQSVPGKTWPGTAPVLMSADENADLTKPESWTFSNPLRFDRRVTLPAPSGVPFFPTGKLTPKGADVRFCGDPCWLESNVVRIYDPDHIFYDPKDRTVLLWMRCHTGLTNIAAVAKGVERADGSLRLAPLKTPAGTQLTFVNCPGGHMKFHLVYDAQSKYYWLAGSQSTDSMTRPDRLSADRYGLPDNERHRLALYFSKNLFDWNFAGMIALGATPRHARHYASMIVQGNDLLILSRSGNERAKSAHNGNLLTLHRVSDFRNLIY